MFLEANHRLIQQEIARFLREFDTTFEAMTVHERKVAIRKLVDTIVVDRKERKVRCYLRRLPLLSPYTTLEPGEAVLGAGGSLNGNRTRISALRGLRPKPLDDKAVVLLCSGPDKDRRDAHSDTELTIASLSKLSRNGAAPQGFEPR